MTPVVLSPLAVARVHGPDSAAFLHAQLTADIAALEDGDATFACYCSPRGQVFGLLLVCRAGNQFLLVANAELLPGILQRLRMYVLRSRVELAPAPDLEPCGLPADGSAPERGIDFRPAGTELCYRVAPVGSGSPAGLDSWRGHELRHNVVWLGPVTTERFIPQMLGLEGIGAVSFSKGCYPGQEVIARARYLGRVKRKPIRLRVPQALDMAPGSALRLLDGEQWLDGTVVDSVVTCGGGKSDETVLFVVAPEPSATVAEVEYAERIYRCATM